MSQSRKVTMRKYGGDDQYSWAVFVDGRPFWTGLSKREASYYRKLELDKVDPGK